MRCDAVLITGASSGIGRALALACARPGATLHLSGRDESRLEAVSDEVRARGAEAMPRLLDVTDRDAMAAWIGGAGRLDLVVANAGISAGTGRGEAETAAQVAAIFATNVGGVVNTVLPAIEAMRRQPPGARGIRGRIAAVASVAAFVAAPGAPAYCASKSAVDRWTIATAVVAARWGVQMTSVCPGYVRTPMTARNRFPMPGLMEADEAARRTLRGVAAGKRRVAFPRWVALLARGTGALPPRLGGVLLGRAEGKEPTE